MTYCCHPGACRGCCPDAACHGGEWCHAAVHVLPRTGLQGHAFLIIHAWCRPSVQPGGIPPYETHGLQSATMPAIRAGPPRGAAHAIGVKMTTLLALHTLARPVLPWSAKSSRWAAGVTRTAGPPAVKDVRAIESPFCSRSPRPMESPPHCSVKNVHVGYIIEPAQPFDLDRLMVERKAGSAH
jgi:hypothetical protein